VAFSVEVSSKQPDEVKAYRIDFSSALDAAWLDPVEMVTGCGLNDLENDGDYFADSNKKFRVKIDTEGTPDKFIWSEDGGATWSSAIDITGTAQLLTYGVSITFTATTGHTKDDEWSFTAHCEETLSSASATAYEWDLRAQVNRSYDLEELYAGADMVEVALYSDGALLGRDTIGLSAGQHTLYFQAINSLPWIEKEGFITTGSVGWGDVEGSQMVWFRCEGGEDRHNYKVSVVALSTKEKHLEADIVIPIENM
jgi:hypothetical protein